MNLETIIFCIIFIWFAPSFFLRLPDIFSITLSHSSLVVFMALSLNNLFLNLKYNARITISVTKGLHFWISLVTWLILADKLVQYFLIIFFFNPDFPWFFICCHAFPFSWYSSGLSLFTHSSKSKFLPCLTKPWTTWERQTGQNAPFLWKLWVRMHCSQKLWPQRRVIGLKRTLRHIGQSIMKSFDWGVDIRA